MDGGRLRPHGERLTYIFNKTSLILSRVQKNSTRPSVCPSVYRAVRNRAKQVFQLAQLADVYACTAMFCPIVLR